VGPHLFEAPPIDGILDEFIDDPADDGGECDGAFELRGEFDDGVAPDVVVVLFAVLLVRNTKPA